MACRAIVQLLHPGNCHMSKHTRNRPAGKYLVVFPIPPTMAFGSDNGTGPILANWAVLPRKVNGRQQVAYSANIGPVPFIGRVGERDGCVPSEALHPLVVANVPKFAGYQAVSSVHAY